MRANVREPWDDGLLNFTFEYRCVEGGLDSSWCCWGGGEAHSRLGVEWELHRKEQHDAAAFDDGPSHRLEAVKVEATIPERWWLERRWYQPPIGPKLSESGWTRPSPDNTDSPVSP